MTELVAVDIGGTHARFALATIDRQRVTSLGPATTLRTADHASFETAWEAFAAQLDRSAPTCAALAIAGSPEGESVKLTNSPWVIRPAAFSARLGLERHLLVNDFSAVAHAVAHLAEQDFRHLCGPDRPLTGNGVISIVGPGTGLGVSLLLRRSGRYDVVATEGGHIDFAPLDDLEDRILIELRRRYRRVSAERVASGLGLGNLYEALAAIEEREVTFRDERALWAAALAGADSLAVAALDRFCLSLGAVAGDIALAQGADAVVIAGGLGLRLADHLPGSGFAGRFVAKGRFERRMAAMPVKLLTHPQAGLYGAAAAFAAAA